VIDLPLLLKRHLLSVSRSVNCIPTGRVVDPTASTNAFMNAILQRTVYTGQ